MTERAQELRANQNLAEKRVWSILRGHRLAGLKFRRQHVLGKYIADFVCLPARLVIEIDGDTHGGEEAVLADAKRTEVIERAGYRVIRFWNSYVLTDHEGGVADTILEALRTSALPAGEKARLVTEGFVSDIPPPRPSP
jgi:very-short-patch-repair endonuclease